MQKEIYSMLLNNKPVKRPSWAGYWKLNAEGDSILMYCKDGQVLDIRSTQRVMYTLDNILADDWVEATPDNCPLLGGTAYIDYPTALQYVFRGIPVYCPEKNVGIYYNDFTFYSFAKEGNQYGVTQAGQKMSINFTEDVFRNSKFILLEDNPLNK